MVSLLRTLKLLDKLQKQRLLINSLLQAKMLALNTKRLKMTQSTRFIWSTNFSLKEWMLIEIKTIQMQTILPLKTWNHLESEITFINTILACSRTILKVSMKHKLAKWLMKRQNVTLRHITSTLWILSNPFINYANKWQITRFKWFSELRCSWPNKHLAKLSYKINRCQKASIAEIISQYLNVLWRPLLQWVLLTILKRNILWHTD